MSRQNILKVIFLSLILTSCGLIEKWKTPEQPTDSKTSATENTDSNTDDLFSKSMNEAKEETASTAGKDAPSNIETSNTDTAKDDFKSFEDEPQKIVTASPESKPVKVEEALPEIKSEEISSITENANSDAGKVMTYKVQKGETLMQIAFKIYGDISKWKDLKQMNGSKLSKNSALRAQMELKYKAPEKNFVWNPEGTPRLIKNGETLGTISTSVYQTPKKWKKLWENNKPLIKNPNMIYAGFTLYYKADNVADYVEPQKIQKQVSAKALKAEVSKIAEEVKVEQAISKLEESAESNEIDLTKEIQSAPIRDINEEIKIDEQINESITK